MNTCLRCGGVVRFDRQRGWVHQDGGLYMMRCDQCGWMGAPYPSPITCPSCGSKGVRDDHCVQAVGRK